MGSTATVVKNPARQGACDDGTTSGFRLELSADQRALLMNILNYYLAQMRYEIADTDNFDSKHLLQHRRHEIAKMHEALLPSAYDT